MTERERDRQKILDVIAEAEECIDHIQKSLINRMQPQDSVMNRGHSAVTQAINDINCGSLLSADALAEGTRDAIRAVVIEECAKAVEHALRAGHTIGYRAIAVDAVRASPPILPSHDSTTNRARL